MELYSERHGRITPKSHTYFIDENIYSLLLNCCTAYKKNLTHIFQLKRHNSFVNADYITFDERSFSQRICILIPSLFRNKEHKIDIPQNGDDYDQYALLDLVEFFGKNIKDVNEQWNDSRYKNYQHIILYDSSEVFNNFKDSINSLFLEAGLLYKLTDQKNIERIVDNDVVTPEIGNKFESLNDKVLNDLLKQAIDLYRTPNKSARQEAIEKLWDAFERLKTYYVSMDKKNSVNKIIKDMSHGDKNFDTMFENEFDELTKIGNSFSIRHHETNQKEITDVHYYDYLFNRCLSLISLSVNYLVK